MTIAVDWANKPNQNHKKFAVDDIFKSFLALKHQIMFEISRESSAGRQFTSLGSKALFPMKIKKVITKSCRLLQL